MTATLNEAKSAPPASDPLWDLTVGAEIDRSDRSVWSGENGVECNSFHDRFTDKDNDWDEGGGVCSRKAHPPHWKHIAATYDKVCGVWGGEELPPDGGEIEAVDPTDVPEPGEFRKLRGRSDLLYVLRVKPDGKVAVLDLSHTSTSSRTDGTIVTLPRYRELVVERVVRRKPTATPPAPEQISQIALWFAFQRDKERDIAIRELRTERLSVETLTTMLSELDLAPYRPCWQGSGRLGIRIKVKNRLTRPSRVSVMEQVGRAFTEWLKTNPLTDVEIEYESRNNSHPTWSHT